MSFATAVAFVLRPDVEGGLVNDSQDPGGLTKGGISSTWHPGVNIAALTPDKEAQIIHDGYWLPIRGDALPATLHIPMLAAAVLAGPETAIRQLQAAAYVPVDGVMGPATLHAVSIADPHALIARFTGLEIVRLATLPGWQHDGAGWATRAARAAIEAFAA